MATITLNYNADDTLALSILEIIKRTDAFTIINSAAKKKSPLQISLRQAKSGKVNNYKSVDDFFKKISQDV